MRRVLNKKEISEVLEILKATYPNTKSQLNFTTPFELVVATILSAQCTDIRVNIVTEELFKHYNTAEEFAELSPEELSTYIKTCGLYKSKGKNIIKMAQMILEEYNNQVPQTMEELVRLPGVGRKTANVVMSNAFDLPAIAVDTHVFRVTNRLGIANAKDVLKTELQLRKKIPEDWWSLSHHLFIYHGRSICKARKPLCEECPVNSICLAYINQKI